MTCISKFSMSSGDSVVNRTFYKQSIKYIFKVLSPTPNLEHQFWFGFASHDIDQDPTGHQLPWFVNKNLKNTAIMIRIVRKRRAMRILTVTPLSHQHF